VPDLGSGYPSLERYIGGTAFSMLSEQISAIIFSAKYMAYIIFIINFERALIFVVIISLYRDVYIALSTKIANLIPLYEMIKMYMFMIAIKDNSILKYAKDKKEMETKDSVEIPVQLL
jgi:hypothetical protein